MDFPELARESQQVWEQNARWWDARMAEGDRWHTQLIVPAIERLLDVQTGERLVDLGCGNGWLARRLARAGAHVLACDFSPTHLECAHARATQDAEVDYRLMDLTDEAQLASLGSHEFNAAVCNMALMDIAAITPLLQAVSRCLKPGGRFVFSIPHPCFNTNGTTLMAERNDYVGDGETTCGVRVTRYLSLTPARAVVVAGQASPYYYFHRPLSQLLATCFAAGFALDGLEEPAFQPDAPAHGPLSWSRCTEIPPVLVGRLRVR